MPVTVRTTGKPFSLRALVTKDAMRQIGFLAVEEIVERTRSGKDRNNRSFARYSPAYRARKQKESGSASPVNLTGWGAGTHMLDDIAIVGVTEHSVQVGPITARATKLARFHAIDGAGKSRVIRDFLGVSKGFLDKVVRQIKAGWLK